MPDFGSTEAECAFWKGRARELKTELDEFTEDSHQLEKELEITLKMKDDQLTDLRHKYNRQQHDNDSLTAKLKQCENELLQWEQRYKKEKAEAEVLRKHTRELEQKNDDLERAHRIVSESVTEFERMLNREYEKNVMLEVEYEMEKENAQIQLQRLMDEARGGDNNINNNNKNTIQIANLSRRDFIKNCACLLFFCRFKTGTQDPTESTRINGDDDNDGVAGRPRQRR